MSKFLPRVPFETTFEGDQVTAELLPLKRKEFMRLLPFLEQAKDERGKVSPEKAVELVDEFADTLVKCVDKFQGLTTAKGDVVTLEQAIQETHFLPLMAEIMTRLFELATLGDDGDQASDAGN